MLAVAHAVDEGFYARRFFGVERISLRRFWHEGKHRGGGVALEEDFLDIIVRRETIDRVRLAAASLRETGEGPLPVFAVIGPPLAGGINEVGVDVEDEFPPGERVLGGGEVERGFGADAEGSAVPAQRRMGGVEGEKRSRRAGQRGQEIPPGPSRPLRVLADRRRGLALCGGEFGRRRKRRELAIAGGVDLDRQDRMIARHRLSPLRRGETRPSQVVHR